MKFLKRSIGALIFATAMTASIVANAQTYPEKPIKLIVPFAPGGGGDQLVLSFVDEFSKELGQPVVKENHGGGNSVIGTNLLAKSPADGYTIGVVTTGFAANPHLYKTLPYDTENDFKTVSVLVAYPFALAVRSDFPAQNVEELIKYAKDNPGKLTSANSGRGAGAEFSTGLLSDLADIQIKNVAFQGAGPGLTAVAGGFVDLTFSNLSSVVPFLEGGKMRVLAHTGTKPFGNPEIKPLAEVGVPGYEFLQWWAVLAPKDTPDAAVDRLNAALVKVFNEPAVRERMAKVNAEFIISTPADARTYISEQGKKSKQIADALGLQPE